MSDAQVLWVNDALAPSGEAHLNARDRGFTLGDGLFETLRVHRGQVLNLSRHLARLRAGAAILDLALAWDDVALTTAIDATLAANGLTEAAVRLTVSRGVPQTRGLQPDPAATPSLVIHARSFAGYPAELYARGMHVVTSRIRRNEYSPLTRSKTLSYLDNVLARHEAARCGADEALLRNTSGELVCASAANLFLVIGDTVVTPRLASGALPGTRRQLILTDLAPELGLGAVERAVRPAEMATATEAFLTNALLGVMPVTMADGRPVGNGCPGLQTERLRSALLALDADGGGG